MAYLFLANPYNAIIITKYEMSLFVLNALVPKWYWIGWKYKLGAPKQNKCSKLQIHEWIICSKHKIKSLRPKTNYKQK